MSYAQQFTRVKPAERISDEGAHTPLKRTLGLLPLVALSVGATLGTGIFVVLAE